MSASRGATSITAWASSYWQEFSARNRGESTPLWDALMPRPEAAGEAA
ncbi:hypothetical protein [Kitasatospora sp. NPDC057936]